MKKSSTTLFPLIVLLFLFLSSGISTSVFAQAQNKDNSAPASSASSSKDTSEHQSTGFQPVIRVGIGSLSYVGNVQTSSGYFQSPSMGHTAYDFGISQKLFPAAEISLNFLFGSLAETEQISTAFWSFKSNVEGGGINLLFKILPKQSVTPYIIIGAEYYRFVTSASLYDQHGTEYYNWSDGTLRSTPQNSPNAESAKLFNLDSPYASDVQTVNLGGPGSAQQSFAIPLGIGFMFHIGYQADFMIGSTLHYTFSNHIDELTPQVKGLSNNDMVVYTYVTLRFNLTKQYPPKKDEEHVYISKERKDSMAQGLTRAETTPKSTTTNAGSATTSTTTAPATNAAIVPVTNAATVPNNTTTNNGSIAQTSSPTTVPATATSPNNTTTTNGSVVKTSPASSTTQPATANTSTPPNTSNATNGTVAQTSAATAPATNTTAPANTTTANAAFDVTTATKPGLVFKIPLGVFRATPDQDFINTFNKLPNGTMVKDQAGLSHYTVGPFNDYKSAQAALAKVQGAGLKSAFIMAFYNGTKITIPEALNMLKK